MDFPVSSIYIQKEKQNINMYMTEINNNNTIINERLYRSTPSGQLTLLFKFLKWKAIFFKLLWVFLYQCWICFIKEYPVSLFPGYKVGYHGFTETVFIVPQPVVLHGWIRSHKELVMHVLQLPVIHPADQSNVDRLCYLLTKCYHSLALNLTYHERVFIH